MNRPLTVVFTGGGTGGHLFPGIAIAEALLLRDPATRVSFAGSKKKIEAVVVPKRGFAFDAIWISGFRRRFSAETLSLPLKVVVSLWQSFRLLRARKPDVVVGTGGYVSGPVVAMAARMGTPTLIQEQNEYPGVTTRALSGMVDEVHITFDSTRRMLPRAKKVVLSGNPVRQSLSRAETGAARRAFGLDPALPVVFVFGGSLGAASINRAVVTMLPRFAEERVQVLWQTGTAQFVDMQRAAAGMPHAAVRAFIDEMHVAYSAATLVVCRAGATSIAELTALGIPAILVPYPHAAADHQRKNARALAGGGAARIVEDAAIDSLEDTLFPLLRDGDALRRMAEAARGLGRPEAAFDIADAVIRLAQLSPSRR
ncbi:MAG: undecaprenyldiphospho-muramoylpentapeptide beta-N-acetylglucosaminyltransferase [Ignavibacteria bacterium]|nr:undecaprenyldiphospho-muramoylpentapeptide beta-N-acetylglucosaminyltransferase [Ignavibacteria bacterium]